MAEWKHKIPVTQFFPKDGDYASEEDMRASCKAIRESLEYHRVFLRYVDLSEDAIEEFSDLAEAFYYESYSVGPIAVSATDFDAIIEDLYDWADKHRIWID